MRQLWETVLMKLKHISYLFLTMLHYWAIIDSDEVRQKAFQPRLTKSGSKCFSAESILQLVESDS